ncbi:alcohol dehydrogenase catalytic domain-containing protein [Fodinisporobacter ferrooxydans]|uniref:Alcohol dehydrogenase catalytic domain-containing protein n=1 Tax=Fodinisporobacter ferrooxydans TaxID=2901836 RepID=A0ABY4CNY3_9BACL|nr:alcohol dehydrogenase catalytic domain-containing protein [Alicyclobacillaceae bacterium MYW30-H2]
MGGRLQVEEVNLAASKANEVLVKIGATVVCHSDLNALHDETTPIPTILGHEGAGVVVEVGENVQTVKPGDKVALSWVPFCGTCEFCKAGQVNLCESAFGPMFAGTLLDGTTRLSRNGEILYHNSLLSTFAEYTVVPEMSCVQIPGDMPLAQASLIGCGVADRFWGRCSSSKGNSGLDCRSFRHRGSRS